MDETRAAERLFELWREIRDLDSAEAVLGWDQETYMPPAGLEGRAGALSTLAGVRHAKLTSAELGDALGECTAIAAPESDLAAQVRRAAWRVDRACKVPATLAKELAETGSRALAAWQEAREASDFGIFRPLLGRMIDLKRQEAAAISPDGGAYDVFLDEHEPGSTEEELGPLFAELRAALAPIVAAVRESGLDVDETAAVGRFDVTAQEAFGREVATAIGFDFAAGRLDASAHPFCTGIGRRDVRMTWRWQEDDFRPALYGIVHESGHGLYEQGLPETWTGSPLGEAVSLGIHESQSRLWENHVARARSFWHWAMPLFRARFPDSAAVTVDRLWPALHVVRPSLIRVEADQVTYNLHVAVRFEIERALFGEGIDLADLPERWNALYEELLGIRPPDDASGVLQDIHWAFGSFGYFPTYTLGTLAAAQLFESAERDLGDLGEAFSEGRFGGLLQWLRENVHAHGSRYEASDLIERATGAPLSAEPFLRHARGFVAEVYGV